MATGERHINDEGLALIQRFESLRLEPYMDANDGWTVGWGHLLRWGEEPRTITREEADELLRQDLAEAERAVERLVLVPLNDNQFSALVSFTYNLGQGNLRKSDLLDKLNQGDYKAVPKELMRWVKDDGKVLKGLIARRLEERKLFEKE